MIDFHNDILPLRDRVFRLALRITLDHDEAEDIAQETFVRVWERRSQWAEIENVQAYCLSVCHSLAVDHVRQRQLHAQKEQEIAEHQRATLVTEEPDERILLLRRLIDQLPEVQRTIMQLRDIEGLRYDEIARVTGLTETQVKVYLHRARTRVKEAIRPLSQ
ncbi:MAG: RNA polymerase sigma factor [Bacteroidaceae bacterium]|nr:RNA polymerase sigma factor [Bacteroidaceae bacterium]